MTTMQDGYFVIQSCEILKQSSIDGDKSFAERFIFIVIFNEH